MSLLGYYREYRSGYVWFFGSLMEVGDYRPAHPYEGLCTCDSRGLTVAI